MSQQTQLITIEQAKKVCPIIATAMIGGVMIAGFVMVPMDVFNQPPKEQMLTMVLGAMAGICILMSMFIPNIVAKSLITKNSSKGDKAFAAAFQTQMIIRMALLEGAAFANFSALSSERNPWTLGVIVWLLVTMILYFPTPGKIDNWIQQKKELADLNQQDEQEFKTY